MIKIILIAISSTIFTLDIVRRHDQSDEKYIALGEEFPAVCKVGINGGDGTLVGSKWIITAAHVAEGMYTRTQGNLKVYFDDGQVVEVEEVYVHPEYDGPSGHDIALLKLVSNVEDISPLPLNRSILEEAKEIIIVGHGYAKAGDETEWITDGKLRAATNRVDRIYKTMLTFDFDTPGDPSTTELEGTAGPGDSGGPMILRSQNGDLVIGISSAGEDGDNGPATYGAVEYYTQVRSHIRWLDWVMKGKAQPIALSELKKRPDEVVMTIDEGEMPEGFFPALGLILYEDNNQLYVAGKIDELVPEPLQKITFDSETRILKLNDQKITTLNDLNKKFEAISSNDTFSIELWLKGEAEQFKLVKR